MNDSVGLRGTCRLDSLVLIILRCKIQIVSFQDINVFVIIWNETSNKMDLNHRD